MDNRKDWWDKSKIIGTLIGVLLIPSVLAIYGNRIDNTIKEKEIRLKYIEIAIGILQADPDPDTQGLRSWAIDVIQTYSIMRFSEAVEKELRKSALPSKNFLLDRDGNVILDARGNPIETVAR